MPYLYDQALGAVLSIVAISRIPGRRFWLQADRLQYCIPLMDNCTLALSQSIDIKHIIHQEANECLQSLLLNRRLAPRKVL